jgi:hypothetical protein
VERFLSHLAPEGPGIGLHPAAGPERPGVALPGCPAPAPCERDRPGPPHTSTTGAHRPHPGGGPAAARQERCADTRPAIPPHAPCAAESHGSTLG